MAGRYEADVLAIVLVSDRKAEAARKFARLGLRSFAERETQNIELLACSAEEKITLVALLIARAIERASAIRQAPRSDIVPGGQHLGSELTRRDEQVAKLDRHVAVDARNRRLAMNVALGEAIDHRLFEAALVVEHVVRDADTLGNAASVIDILACATGALAMDRSAVVVQLQRHPDHVVTFRLEQRSRHRRVDTAGHGDDDAGVFRPTVEIEAVAHGSSYYRWRSKACNASHSTRQILPF